MFLKGLSLNHDDVAVVKKRLALWIFAYLAIHFLIRLTLGGTLGWDDSEQALWSQELSPGYTLFQPPFYSWLFTVTTWIFGQNVLTTALVRYGLMLATYLLILDMASRLVQQGRQLVLAVTGYGLIYVFAYYAHHDLTNTTLLSFALALSLNLFLRLPKNPNLLLYSLLGVGLGIGLLAKFNFLLFMLALVVAALICPGYRGALLNWRMVWSGGIVLLMFSPYAFWYIENGHSVAGMTDEILAPEGPSWMAPVLALGLWLVALLSFPQPLVLVMALLFPESFRWHNAGGKDAGSKGIDEARRFLGWTILVAAVAVGVGGLLAGVTELKSRWMHPVLMFLPLYLFSGDLNTERLPKRLRIFLRVLIVFSALVLISRFVTHHLEPRNSRNARQTVPIAGLREPIERLGLNNPVFVAERDHLGGNLVFAIPGAEVYTLEDDPRRWDVPRDRDRLYLWVLGDEHIPERIQDHIVKTRGIRLDAIEPDGVLSVPFPSYPERTMEVAYLIIESEPR